MKKLKLIRFVMIVKGLEVKILVFAPSVEARSLFS